MRVASTLTIRALARFREAGCLVEKEPAGGAAPAGIGVGEKVADVRLSQRPQDRIANRMHQHVGIGVSLQSFAVRDLHAAQDQPAPLDQGVNVVTNANMNHAPTIGQGQRRPQPKDSFEEFDAAADLRYVLGRCKLRINA